MGRPYSMDLRERVVAAVEQEGLSRHQAAARFGVGVSTAINSLNRVAQTGSVAPGQMGGHKPTAISGAPGLAADPLQERAVHVARSCSGTGGSRPEG